MLFLLSFCGQTVECSTMKSAGKFDEHLMHLIGRLGHLEPCVATSAAFIYSVCLAAFKIK